MSIVSAIVPEILVFPVLAAILLFLVSVVRSVAVVWDFLRDRRDGRSRMCHRNFDLTAVVSGIILLTHLTFDPLPVISTVVY